MLLTLYAFKPWAYNSVRGFGEAYIRLIPADSRISRVNAVDIIQFLILSLGTLRPDD